MHNSAHKAGSLHTSLQKNTLKNFIFIGKQTKVFRDLIDTNLSSLDSDLFEIRLNYFLDADVSAYIFAYSIQHKTRKTERHTIDNWSRSPVPSEQNYQTSKRESLTIFWGLKPLYSYYSLETFIVHTDCSACTGSLPFKNSLVAKCDGSYDK